MSIRFTCPCGATFNVAVEKAGHRGKCPRCGIKFMIPSQGAPEGEDPPVAKVYQPSSAEEAPLAASEPSDDERAPPPLIDTERKGLSEKDPSTLARSFWGAFAYPLSSRGITTIIVAMVVFPIALGVSSVALFIGFLGTIVTTVYLVSFYMSIITETLGGEDDVPDWPDFTDLWGEILQPYLRTLGVVLLTFLPVIVLLIIGVRVNDAAEDITPAARPYFTAAAVFGVVGILYLPMAYLAACVLGGVLAVSPAIVIPAMIAAARDYIATLGLMVLILVINGVALLALSFARIGALIEGSLFTALFMGMPVFAVNFYFWMVLSRVLGLLYRRNAEKLAWGYERR